MVGKGECNEDKLDEFCWEGTEFLSKEPYWCNSTQGATNLDIWLSFETFSSDF